MVDSMRAPSPGRRLAALGRDARARARLDASVSPGVVKRTARWKAQSGPLGGGGGGRRRRRRHPAAGGGGGERGGVVAVPLGRARRRGVVVETSDVAPPDVEPVAVERVLGSVSPALVDLALWMSEYYASPPGRGRPPPAPPRPGPPGGG